MVYSVVIGQNRVNVNNLVQYGEKYFKENDDKPFNGIVFEMSKETGNKILQYKMVDGLKNGFYQEWYPDGKPKSKGKYLNNTIISNWTFWYENGEKEEEGTFKKGKKDGLWTTWYEEGQKRYEVRYENGEKEGLNISYYRDGSIFEKVNWKKDQIDGNVFSYYDGSGNLAAEIPHEDGKTHGIGTEWYENGTKKSEVYYAYGMGLTKQDYYENGNKSLFQTSFNGELNGPWVLWNENGQKQQYGMYKNGEFTGTFIEYYENGNKKSEETDNGLHTYWHENGNKEAECLMINQPWGKVKHGLHTIWYENGQIKEQHKYEEGEPIDKHHYYYENGQKKREYTPLGKYEKKWSEDGTLIYHYENKKVIVDLNGAGSKYYD